MMGPTGQRRRESDDGFTLIELLVVVVILPLLMGAVAEAFIVAYRDNAANSNRISDTDNTQLTQDFFIKDVQGASYITTWPNSLFGSYVANSPQVCTPSTSISAATGTISGSKTSLTTPTAFFTPAMNGLAVSDSLGYISPGTTLTYVSSTSATLSKAATSATTSNDEFSSGLLLALYHPAVGSGSALDIAYWAEGSGSSSEVDRYSCTQNSTTHVSSSPVKAAVASAPPPSGLGVGQTAETITVSAEIDPSQFSSAAQSGWTSTGAFTTAQSFSTGPPTTLTVGSTSGFANGTITLVNTSGSQQLTGCTVATTFTGFTGCSTPTGTVTNGTAVTQSNISSVQITVAQPASSYTFNLLAAPRVTTPQSSSNIASPNLLTLGTDGISPVHGGGTAKCPDGTTANICIGNTGTAGTAVVDSGGVVYCTGGGGHTYIHFQNNSGSVDTTSPETSSSCSNVTVTGSVPTVPDPLLGNLPNNGCFPTAIAGSMIVNPSTVGGNAVPGIYTTPLNGTLEPGIYIIEDGVGNVTPPSMATPSSTDPYYQVPYNSGSANYDKYAGVLFFVPGPSSAYSSSPECYADSTYGASTALTGSISGVVPYDATQAANDFSGNTSLGGLWTWQDPFNTNDVTVTGYSSPAPSSSESGGLLYAPSADYTPPSPAASLSTGSMVIAGTSSNGTHLSLCLNWTYTANCGP